MIDAAFGEPLAGAGKRRLVAVGHDRTHALFDERLYGGPADAFHAAGHYGHPAVGGGASCFHRVSLVDNDRTQPEGHFVSFEYVSVEEAIGRNGLRMVVVGSVPSPWGEAAKGILHIKRVEWVAVRLTYVSDALKQWAGQRSGPVAIYDKEEPRAGWREILLLAERLAPAPPLLPADPARRDLVLGLSNDLFGEGGLGWSRRLHLIHAGLHGAGGFPGRTAAYLGKKYGHSDEAGAMAGARVVEMLGALASRLAAQHEAGSTYYVGDSVTAVDVYAATCMALFRPLPQAQCDMEAAARASFETLDAPTAAALDPILFAHRDMMYAMHLELPLSL